MSGANIYFTKTGFNSQTFVIDGTFNVPTGVTNVIAVLVAGGGGGAGGNKSGSNGAFGDGGGGGAGGEVFQSVIDVTSGGTVGVNVGLGGAGGNGATTPANGTDGADGQDTIITVGSRQYAAYGGLGAKWGIEVNPAPVPIPPSWNIGFGGFAVKPYQTAGGKGKNIGGTSPDAANGEDSQFNYGGGGILGTDDPSFGGGGGGGGGGASWGVGGSGGASVSGAPGTNGIQGGGGGGGIGNGTSDLTAGDGGNGGNGLIIFYWKKD